MATKKKTTETEMTPEEKEMALVAEMKAIKAERDALLKEVEALKGEAKEPEPEPVTNKPEADYWNERVPYEAFYDGDKYSDDISVKVNGKRFLIKRGKRVMIPRYVAHVLENQSKQLKYSADYNRGLHDEFVRDTKKYIGE